MMRPTTASHNCGADCADLCSRMATWLLSVCCPPLPCLIVGANSLPGVDHQRVSSEFPFHLNETFYDDDIFGIKFHMCGRSSCAFRGRHVPCFHGQCFASKLLPVSPG